MKWMISPSWTSAPRLHVLPFHCQFLSSLLFFKEEAWGTSSKVAERAALELSLLRPCRRSLSQNSVTTNYYYYQYTLYSFTTTTTYWLQRDGAEESAGEVENGQPAEGSFGRLKGAELEVFRWTAMRQMMHLSSSSNCSCTLR